MYISISRDDAMSYVMKRIRYDFQDIYKDCSITFFPSFDIIHRKSNSTVDWSWQGFEHEFLAGSEALRDYEESAFFDALEHCSGDLWEFSDILQYYDRDVTLLDGAISEATVQPLFTALAIEYTFVYYDKDEGMLWVQDAWEEFPDWKDEDIEY